mgnify:CR=1 FL=1
MGSEITFNHQTPENTDSVWEALINDRCFTFTKTCRKGGVFLYSCKTTKGGAVSVTSFFSERNLTPDELEALPQFVAFISATM